MSIETSRSHSNPRLIIEERLYTRLVALAERARAQAPELADRLLSAARQPGSSRHRPVSASSSRPPKP